MVRQEVKLWDGIGDLREEIVGKPVDEKQLIVAQIIYQRDSLVKVHIFYWFSKVISNEIIL